jgi:iron complex transport system permease protein
LSLSTWNDVVIAATVVFVGAGILWTRSAALNAMAIGDEFASQAGINVVRTQTITYAATSLIVGALVALVGAVGFVGLVVPHIVRRITGPDNRIVFPVSFLVGAAFLMLADLFSRTLVRGTELPIGAVTAVIGAPLFLYILRRRER